MCGSAGGPFPDKPIYETRISEAIRSTKNVIDSALVLTATFAQEPEAISQIIKSIKHQQIQ